MEVRASKPADPVLAIACIAVIYAAGKGAIMGWIAMTGVGGTVARNEIEKRANSTSNSMERRAEY